MSISNSQKVEIEGAHNDYPFKASKAQLWSSMIKAVFWKICDERNNRNFQDKERPFEDVLELAVFNRLYSDALLGEIWPWTRFITWVLLWFQLSYLLVISYYHDFVLSSLDCNGPHLRLMIWISLSYHEEESIVCRDFLQIDEFVLKKFLFWFKYMHAYVDFSRNFSIIQWETEEW